MLALSCAGNIPRSDGDNKPAHRGEHEVSRKAIAQGKSECFRCPVCSCAPKCTISAHETAGAARTRHSLRPLLSKRGNEFVKARAKHAARRRKCAMSCNVRCAACSACGMMRCRPGTQESGLVWGWRDGSRLCGAPLKKRCTASGTREAWHDGRGTRRPVRRSKPSFPFATTAVSRRARFGSCRPNPICDMALAAAKRRSRVGRGG